MPQANCSCGATLEVPARLYGKLVQCSSCGKQLRIAAPQPAKETILVAKPIPSDITAAQPTSQPVTSAAAPNPFNSGNHAPTNADPFSQVGPQTGQQGQAPQGYYTPAKPASQFSPKLFGRIAAVVLAIVVLVGGGIYAFKLASNFDFSALGGDSDSGNPLESKRTLAAQLAGLESSGYSASAAGLDAAYQLPAGKKDLTTEWLALLSETKREITGRERADLVPVNLGTPMHNNLFQNNFGAADKAEALVQRHEAWISRAKQNIESESGTRLPLDFSLGSKLSFLDSVEQLDEAVGLLLLDAWLSAESEKFAECVGSLKDCYAACGIFNNLHLSTVQLKASDLHQRCDTFVVFLIDNYAFPEAELERLQSVVQSHSRRVAADKMLAGDLALHSTELEQKGMGMLAKAKKYSLRMIDRADAVSDEEKAFYVASYRVAINVALQRSLRDLREFGLADLAERESKESRYGPYQAAAHLLPDFADTANRLLSDVASQRITVTSIAIARYKLQHDNKAPQRLAELEPEYLRSIPLDPHVDKPLLYKPTKSGFFVYSVGSDLRDDAGDSNGLEPDQKLAYDERLYPKQTTVTYAKPSDKERTKFDPFNRQPRSGSLVDAAINRTTGYVEAAARRAEEERRKRSEEMMAKENDF